MFKKFGPNDLFYNQVKTYPNCNFLIYDRKVYYNNKNQISGSSNSYSSGLTDFGYINLYELMADRASAEIPYPFIIKDGGLSAFKTVDIGDYNMNYLYGDIISSSYPLLSTISSDYYSINSERPQIDALQNTLNHYKIWSKHYEYDSDLLGDKSTQILRLISIPSIFFGSSIQKGSVDLRFYISGTLAAQVQDIYKNGNLVQTNPENSNGSGSVAGVVLYNEGFILLTGSWVIDEGYTEPYIPGDPATYPRWVHFGSTGSTGAGENLFSSSFYMDFNGVNYVPTITMLTFAEKGECNFSNNPTYIKYGQTGSIMPYTSSINYRENDEIQIKNTIKTIYSDPTGSFQKQTYISKIGIYDENKNLIAIAKLANPLRKRDADNYCIKLKIDI